jgi:hypothetical protein
MQTPDPTSALREAISIARSAGLVESSRRLEERALAAYTTSSELAGELGEAIGVFLKDERGRIPRRVRELLDVSLREVVRIWPGYRYAMWRNRIQIWLARD